MGEPKTKTQNLTINALALRTSPLSPCTNRAQNTFLHGALSPSCAHAMPTALASPQTAPQASEKAHFQVTAQRSNKPQVFNPRTV